MKRTLGRLWTSRDPRERRVLVALAIVLVLGAWLWLMHSAQRARARLIPAVAQLRVDAARVERGAAEIARLRAMPVTPPAQTDMRQLVQAQVDAGGLAHALVSIEALDPNQVRVVFGAVSFADWLGWLDRLHAQQIRLDSARIEPQATPGLVSVVATLSRPTR